MDSAEYTTIETVAASPDATIVRAVRRADGLPVLLKVLQSAAPQSLRRLLKEREVGTLLESTTILSPIDLVSVDGHTTLVLLDNRGHSLEDDLGRALGVELALTLAIRIGTKLSELHACGVVHRDLKPDNVFVSSGCDDVRLTGLGVALSSIGSYRPSAESGLIEGTFAYMAPEQTGQTGLLVDQRADLYSLGVVLYRMLTGRLPFDAVDALGWIHAQVAKKPPSVTTLVEGLPPIVAGIVEKLLSKDPEERYQTARGVVADLEVCLACWRERRSVPTFVLGQNDVPERLQIPHRLYGRESELRALTSAFAAVPGPRGLVLLAGAAGVGKSSVARALESHVRSRGGIFVEGKHEALRGEVPYFAVAQALEQLAERMLMENEKVLAASRARIRTALGASASLLTTLAPKFGLVLGESAAEEPATLAPSADRFKLFFRRFLSAVASEEHPIVFFLDDLQWADAASIDLLEHVLARPDTDGVLTVGAFRNTEVDAGHPLAGALTRLRGQGLVSEISIGPLAPRPIAELLVDAFHCAIEEAKTLAALLFDRTGGNPLFVIELLATLHHQGLIRFDREKAQWRWDVERIGQVPLADEAAQLLLAKIEDLPPSLREALCVGACLGIEFRAADVSAVVDRSVEEVETDFYRAATSGLLLYGGRTFRFPHDRVCEAAYSLRPPEERAALHLRIGRTLMTLTSEAEREQRSFVLADQLNLAASLMTEKAERVGLAVLDLAVGQKAKAASAYASAVRYFESGMSMLDADAWEQSYATTYGLHLDLAACNLVLGRLDDAERLLRVILENARTLPERAAAYAVLVDLRMTQGDIATAVKVGIEGVHACGFEMPSSATPEERTRAVIETWALLGNAASRASEALANLPRATDPKALAAAELWTHLGNPTLYYDNNLFVVFVSRALAATLAWGVTEATPPILGAFGLVLGAITGRFEDAWSLGHIAYEMAQRPGLSAQKPSLCVTFASLLNYWRHHVRSDLPYLEEGLESAYQLGDSTYVAYSVNHIVMTRFIMGVSLDDLEIESERAMKRIVDLEFDEMADLMLSRHLLIRSLRGGTVGLGDLGTPERSQDALSEHFATVRTPLTSCWHLIDRLQAEFFGGKFEQAIATGKAAIPLLQTSPMFPITGEHAFYFALALTSGATPATPNLKSESAEADIALAETYRQALERWATSCPENFSHKHALVHAELARLRGDDLTAIRGYEQAIHAAQDNGFVQVQAIAYELAARFYRMRGFGEFAELYLKSARDCYARWGATAKVRSLEQSGRWLRKAPHVLENLTAETVAARSEDLDLLTVTRASEALSAEVVRARLLERLLDVMLRYAGARRCCFVTDQDGAPEMAALAPGIAPGGELPQAIINYCRRTRERVLLHDATQPNPFSADPSLCSRGSGGPRSVLCLPVSRKDHLLGLIYLENDLAPGVFSEEHVHVLEVLAAQAAISLEGTAAFSALEIENAQRRRAEASLRDSRKHLQAVLENMVDAVLVCDTNRRITFINQAATRALGVLEREDFPSVEAMAKNFRMRHPDGHPFATFELPLIRALGGEVVVSVDATLTNPRERDVHVRISAAPVKDDDGRVVGAVEAVSDVTEKEELDRLRDQFLRMTAHELKTPVAIVTGYAELLLSRREKVPPREQRMLDALLRGSRRIDGIVSDLLFLWQLRSGRVALVKEDVVIDELLARIVDRLQPPPDPSRVQISSTQTAAVRGDRLLLDKLFHHLIDNALRFSPGTPGGPVEVSLATPPQGGVEIAIKDHGVGIAPEKQARIFELFYRAHAETAYDVGGMGAGLYLSNVIVDRHGGSIRFESHEGQGSTFTVWLPTDSNDAPPPTTAHPG